MRPERGFVTLVSVISCGISTPLVRRKGSGRFRRQSDSVISGGEPVLSTWLPFLFYAVFAAAIPATMIFGSFVVPRRPRARTRQKMLPFESGVSEGAPSRERRFTVSFYLTAILFILFDIEIVFLYPLAVRLDALGWFGFWELATFVVILGVAYVYVWRKGALNWH
jgi:NADH-quinone oxidoreductase subunit A